MKLFLIKSSLLILPLLAIIVLSDVGINYFENNRSFYKVKSTNKILILGNSHPQMSLNDSLIDNSINFSHYGESYFCTYYKMKKLCEANPAINTIILEYTNNVFEVRMNEWIYGEASMGVFYPKYSQLISPCDKLFLLTKNPGPYIIAFKEGLIKKYKFSFAKQKDIFKYFDWGSYSYWTIEGVAGLKEKLNQDKLNFWPKIDTTLTSPINIEYLKKIVNYCKEKKINLILFRSPLHELYPRDYETELQNLKGTEFHDIPFWDYSNYKLEDNEFTDFDHVNYKGARKLSKDVNSRLNQEFISN